ncbi:serine/threonine-protein kinase pim-2-like [Rhinichthys klamathensis goyatoka]|uniref:serine/threonine-protein kinase pim-2-like n=1 Tax=Rhinichthys klamathensis goyatoka TaxID=3034132 RepID=UPI0024B5F576|nr:serine/threonine-protein kinase pim-2-like [Rhinichthys klamathensis goyatoka]
MSTPSLSRSVGNVERWLCGLSSFSSRGTYITEKSSRGTYIIEKRSSDNRSESQHEQVSHGNRTLSRSDSLNRSLSRSNSFQELMCPPLPGQVPVEPTGTSNVPTATAQGAMEASPVNKSSTEKPTKRKKLERICSLFRNVWTAIKSPFLCCSDSKAVDVVEPFVPPLDLDSEPDSDPDHSGVEPHHDSFESLYNAGEMIGSGGFGRVFKGTRKFDGKKVAIKRMRKTCNDLYLAIPGRPEPLITEVALLLMMRQEPISPYAIQLHDWFEHPRKFTLVMEYPEPCESLLDFIIRNPQLDETTARVIMRQAVLAVQHCIEHDVFHNDIHAHNFLLKKDTLELKLIDFGSGQLLSSDGYDSDIYIGLLDYCPPEVFTEPRFHAVPANVWSLGVLLYEMVNACPPFHNPTEIKEAKVTFQNANLSNECSDLIIQCLTLDPTKRPTLEQILQHRWIRNDLL